MSQKRRPGMCLRLFVAGGLFSFSLQSLHQDYLGRDAFIALASQHWVSGWWTVPLALLLAITCLLIFARYAIDEVFGPPEEQVQVLDAQEKSPDDVEVIDVEWKKVDKEIP